ncbi:hypothetical protein Pint_27243 [Pistacia integerrima]|uniref:Uncharacterized protein n=1 Tax=Pistacia integerrima TaxID=434235 RepID=A0ACC0YT14_9ROSI|nr:hypothetical protein Pint_27243 [Pistacia integerrima]
MMGVVGEICGKWLSGTAMEVANGGNTQYGMEKLVGNNNYKYWRMWDSLPIFPEHAESRRKWKIKCGKTLFALRTSISKEVIDHVRDVSSPKEVWDTLEKLCTKNNLTRLRLLENELAMLKQGGMSISEYFLRVKSICAEISEIDADDKISEARLRRYLVGGLRKEYGLFVTSIQGWSQQPSAKELENLLSNQEALAKQMAKNFESDAVLFSKGKPNKKNTSAWNKTKEEDSSAEKGGNSQSKKSITCFRCGKTGHIKRNCRVKISKANVACASEGDDQLKWEQCFTVEEVEEKSVQTLVNYVKNDKEEWIIDSGCSHHVTGNDTLFSEMRQHHGERVIVTVDNSTYPIAKEGVVTIDVADDTRTSSVKLNDVYHVPGLKKNLVSVSQITDSGKYVLFGPNDVKVLDNVKDISADVILTGEKRASLFVLSAGEAYVKKTSQINSAAIWHARKGWRCMDPGTNKFVTSRDVVFDEVSSLCFAQKPVVKNIALDDDQDNFEPLFPEINLQAPSNDETENESPRQNIQRLEDGEQQAVRRSTRETRQPDHLKDYELATVGIVGFGWMMARCLCT